MFSENFYPELSGISDSLIESARELSGLGHDIDFYVPHYSKKDFATSNVPPSEPNISEGVKIHRYFSFPYPAPTKQGRMVIPTFLRSFFIKNKPDIIHTHLFFGCGMEGLAASFFLRVPLVGTSHTPITEFMRYGPVQSPLLEKLALNFVSWYYNHCDFVTAPSQGILDEMKRHGFHKPCRVISNPIDLDSFSPPTQEEAHAAKTFFRLSPFTVLYTGRLAPEKHIDIIIRAIAMVKEKIPEINFAVTGHGEGEVSLKKLAEELGVNEQVKFFGTLSTEKHALIYKAADVFAIASTAETQSLSLMKAMATSLPVIGAKARGLAEYITEANGFFIEPGDVKTLAEHILFLYTHPEERIRLGQGGLHTVKQFSRAKIASDWSALYKEVIAAKKK